MESTSSDSYAKRLDEVRAIYHGIHINYTSAQEHVPRAERNNRTIQERVRAEYYNLPYIDLPRIMVK